ncbi:VCBS repeat-containing protein [Archangium violaceum]|uniref:FG-GAP repeat domain-containing protein n=1 Tax=Archangium violaceum TaxID=83451 RepID=UPI002B319B74|nr:VCBS repeat-containing protein [Archangium violaceum]
MEDRTRSPWRATWRSPASIPLAGLLAVWCATAPSTSFGQEQQLPSLSAQVSECSNCLLATSGSVTIKYEWTYTAGSYTVVGNAPSDAKVRSVYLSGAPTGQAVTISRIDLSHRGWTDAVFKTYATGGVWYPTSALPATAPWAGHRVNDGEWIATPTVLQAGSNSRLFMNLVINWYVPDTNPEPDPVPVGNKRVSLGPDFDGDARADTAVFTPKINVGGWLVNLSNGTDFSARNWTGGAEGTWSTTQIPFIGDFDGDGKADTGVHITGSGEWVVNRSTGSGFTVQYWGEFPTAPDGIPLAGDVDGDGKEEAIIFGPEQRWTVLFKDPNGNRFVRAQAMSGAGNWGEIPLAGDFNGDGRTDTAVMGNAIPWTVNLSTGSGWQAQQWPNGAGIWGDFPLAGDFNGDGKTDIALFTRNRGWWVNLSTGSGWQAQQWPNGAGAWGDIPIVGDFNGDKKADTGVFTPGGWKVNLSTGSGWVVQHWPNGAGTWGDIPLNAPPYLIYHHVKRGRPYHRQMLDFNRDGYSDVLWYNPGARQVSVWHLQDANVLGATDLAMPSGSSEWAVRGSGDFNRDGSLDLLWYNPNTRQVSVWYLDGTTVLGSADVPMPGASSEWQVRGSGDFNRDGYSDVIWYNPGTRQVSVWHLRNNNVYGVTDIATPSGSSEWDVRGVGDFNRDGDPDLLWYNPNTRQVSVWYLDSTTVIGSSDVPMLGASSEWQVRGSGDFNRDGSPDVLWHNASTGVLSVWYLNGTNVIGVSDLSWRSSVDQGWNVVSY